MKTLKEKILEEAIKGQKILQLIEEFPFLREDKDRWGNIYYVSVGIAEIANDVDFGYSCGCCDDAVLYAMPFIEKYGIRVYNDPKNICIGEKYDYFAKADNNWEAFAIENGCNEKVIEIIRKFFEKEEKLRNSEEEI